MTDLGVKCDIMSILECRENEEFELLQRLSAFFEDLKCKTEAYVENYLAREKEYEQNQEEFNEHVAELHKINRDKITESDNIHLQQKVTDKKIVIAKNQQTKLEEEINDAKLKKESISLQMVDLTQELEDARKMRKEVWTAIKRACSYYKEYLDVHIDYEPCENYDKVKVTFFQRENPERDNHFVTLENDNNNWKVGEILPALNEKHMDMIKSTIDLTKPLGLLDVVAFLCKLRNVFSKHYFKE